MTLPAPTGTIAFYLEAGTTRFRAICRRGHVSPAIPGRWAAGHTYAAIARRSCWRWMGAA